MRVEQIRRILKRHSATIVHFSGHAKVGKHAFPADLHHSIRKVKSQALSCHVIWPGLKFSTWGDVGLILEPLRASNILGISAFSDGGFIGNSIDYSGRPRLSKEALLEVFKHAGNEHNDIRVKGAKVVGILAMWSESQVSLANDEFLMITPSQLRAEFRRPVFHLHRDKGVFRVA
jgi:hypothetical protein